RTRSGRCLPVRIEEIEDRREVRRHHIAMMAPGHLNVLDVDTEPPHLHDHRARALDVQRRIGSTVHDDLRDVLHLLDRRRRAQTRDRTERGPDVRVLCRDLPCANGTHRVPHQIDPTLVDAVLLLDALQHVHDVLLTVILHTAYGGIVWWVRDTPT